MASALILTPAPPKKISYSRDVLPILSEKCFRCHGPDSTARQANLRLDTPEGAFADRSGRWAIVPHSPQTSLVIHRINDGTSPMPPAYSGLKLTPTEISTLTQWIAQGAQYAKLWSFAPIPKTVAVPKVAGPWPRNDVDRFILARLNQAHLAASKPASRERWLRRVTLDLTGLPPTEAEISAFVRDDSKVAFERVVDRLLASPHFGERIAVDWLDAARYSDSYGYQSDLISPTWPYRDWVVKAFNDNLPYDRFLTDQLAGDLLPSAGRGERLATAFNRLHRQSNEGGSIPLEFKTEYAVDRVDTFGTAVLGLTIGCACCHDHKFDPISQKEYYQLFAYFNSIDESGLLLSTEIVPTPSMLLPTPDQENRLRQARTRAAEAERRLAASQDDESFQKWLATKPKPDIPGLLARLSLDKVESGKFRNEVDGKLSGDSLGALQVVPGPNRHAVQFDGDDGLAVRGLPAKDRWDPFTWSFWIEDPRAENGPVILLHRTGGTDVGFCGFDLTLEDGYLTARVMRHWPGNALGVRSTVRVPKGEWTQVAWSWDGSDHASGLKLYIDGKPIETTVLADRLWKNVNAYGDLGPSGGDWCFGQRFRDAGFKDGRLSDVAYADRAMSDLEVSQLFDGNSLANALDSPKGHEAALRAYYLSALDPKAKAARNEIKLSQVALAKVENEIQEVSIMEEAKRQIPAYILARGRYDAPRNEKTLVHRDTPKSLPPLEAKGSNDRLALAEWATRPDNPLTARVAVNRLWQMVFGVGLVETSENFGSQGARPSHPELLDYLARQFIDSGWNVKKMLKMLVLSATYRQDSVRTPRLNEVDPDNRLLARGPSGRLTAEMIRDTALAASGLLNPRIGGPPVNPYQPAGIWTENNDMTPSFVQSKGRDLYRRSLYSTWKRTTPVPSMMVFDATSREACVVRRQTTDTPLQALVLLNDVQFVEAARVLAERLLQTPVSDSSRIQDAFLRLAGRPPTGRETSILRRTLNEQRVSFDSQPGAANKLIHEGESPPPTSVSPNELAAMTVTMQTVLNSDAVIWKR